MSKINKISVDGVTYDIEDKSVPSWAKSSAKPSYKTSELENDSNFITETKVDEKIANVATGGGVDLSNYALKVDLDSKTNTSVLPNDNGDIKTRYRICNKSEDESPVVYFPIVKLPADNSKNRASVILRGRIGGYLPQDMAMIDALIWNRGTTGISLLNINADTYTLEEPLRLCDIVVYTNEDNTDTVYLKCKEYFVFDFNLEVYQETAQILYDGTYLTEEPSGALSAAASTSNKRVEIYNGKLYINGSEIGGGSLDIYSTEEQVIGTWVNGKTIYQRTIIGQLGTTENTNINVGDNMYVMQVIGFIDYPPENCNIPFEYTNPKAPIYYNVTRNVIRLYHSTVFANQTYYATVIYTKTNE